MEYVSIQKNVGDSPRKLRLVADMVRGLTPEKAIEILQFTNKAAALPLAKAIKTALANAASSASGAANLVFKKIEINEGMKMKRYRVGTAGRGRGRPYKRRLSHIKIVLSDEQVEVKSQKAKFKNESENSKVKKQKGVEQTKDGTDDLAVKPAKSEEVMSKSV